MSRMSVFIVDGWLFTMTIKAKESPLLELTTKQQLVNTADREDLVGAVVICRVCWAVKRYNYLLS
jgi:hypothetical protein